MTLPEHARVVVIGAGIHGLSTAWHLAQEWASRGGGSGSDIVILDKTGVGAGPSGIACGVIRNNYFQPAMRELMAHSVEVWESDPEAFHYHPIGYLQIGPEVMREDVAQIHEEQKAIGYPSELIEGEDDCRTYMESIFSDWQAQEHLGGPAREEGWLRREHAVDAWARGEERGARRGAPHAGHRHRSDGRRRGGHRRGDRPGDHRLRSARRGGRSVGAGLLAHARPPR